MSDTLSLFITTSSSQLTSSSRLTSSSLLTRSTTTPTGLPSVTSLDAEAPTSFTTALVTLQIPVPGGGTTTLVTASVITDPAVYISLSAVAAASALSSKPSTSFSSRRSSSLQNTSPTGSSSPTSGKSSPHLSTIIPAVVVPILFILLVLGLGYFILKRRQQRTSGVQRTQSRYEKPELDATEVPRTHGRTEPHKSGGASLLSQFSRRSRKHPKENLHELPGSEPIIAELEGDATNRNA